MGENVITSSALTDVAERPENGMPENEDPGTAVPENNAISGSCTAEPENDVNIEPEWYRNGDAWVKLFLEPVEPGKFKQHDHIYSVPGENEFPIERWSSKEYKDGFHITRRKDVWRHLELHDFKSAYIAEVVSMGEEFYDNLRDKKRKVRVVAFGPAFPLTEVLGKHPDDFKDGQMLDWSAVNNHLELVRLSLSKNPEGYFYSRAFRIALENGNDQIADFLIEKFENVNLRPNLPYNAIRYGRVDLVKRLLENMPVDIRFFKAACLYGQFEIFQLLRAKYGEPKCSDIIFDALNGGNVNILNYLKSRGVDMSDFGMFVYACTHCALPNTVRYLVSEGANVNHPLIAYIAKRHARMEVRRILLDQIDDKSEVPGCKKIEGEIVEICENFIKMIEEGKFERI
jgi:hypothetical protein